MNYTLITGACGGLGRALLAECVKTKDNLILVGTSEKKLAALCEEMKEDFAGLDIKTITCNLGKLEDRVKVVDFVKENNLVVNRLVNNAGVIIEGELLKAKDEDIINAIEVNCVGTLDLTQKLLKIRDENQKFEVLTIASQAAFQPIPRMAVYAATKSFLVSMMTALAIELKDKNVVFTTICPSGMATTDAMKESIASMGLNGKLTTLPVEKVAKISFKALKKKKTVVIPGTFNKFVGVISKPFSVTFLAKTTGRMWKKSQTKRNF